MECAACSFWKATSWGPYISSAFPGKPPSMPFPRHFAESSEIAENPVEGFPAQSSQFHGQRDHGHQRHRPREKQRHQEVTSEMDLHRLRRY